MCGDLGTTSRVCAMYSFTGILFTVSSTLRKPLAKRNNVIGVGRRRKLGFMRGVERCGRSAGAIQGDTEVALG